MENRDNYKYFIELHSEHCCPRCGCKYDNKDCPVVLGKVQDISQCKDCEDLFDDAIQAFF